MGKGYAEGPALEERLAELDRAKREGERTVTHTRNAVFGSTSEQPTPHFLGWADDVDADELFASGAAYGIRLRRVPA